MLSAGCAVKSLRRLPQRRKRSRDMIRGEERMRVLRMVESGKITAEEATQLLESLDDAPTSPKGTPPPVPGVPPSSGGRWFRVRVTDARTGKLRVNVRLPVGVV